MAQALLTPSVSTLSPSTSPEEGEEDSTQKGDDTIGGAGGSRPAGASSGSAGIHRSAALSQESAGRGDARTGLSSGDVGRVSAPRQSGSGGRLSHGVAAHRREPFGYRLQQSDGHLLFLSGGLRLPHRAKALNPQKADTEFSCRLFGNRGNLAEKMFCIPRWGRSSDRF